MCKIEPLIEVYKEMEISGRELGPTVNNKKKVFMKMAESGIQHVVDIVQIDDIFFKAVYVVRT